MKMPLPPAAEVVPEGTAAGRVLRLSRSRVVLWARDPGSNVPFEVSKVVQTPLQPACPSAPRCPGEAAGSPSRGSLYVDPEAAPGATCAYSFSNRGECLKTRNQLALEAALFPPGEVTLTRRLLQALGFDVREESIDTNALEPRILNAHGPIGARHQVRTMRSPSAGPIVLVRRLPTATRTDGTKSGALRAAQCAVRSPGRGSQ